MNCVKLAIGSKLFK